MITPLFTVLGYDVLLIGAMAAKARDKQLISKTKVAVSKKLLGKLKNFEQARSKASEEHILIHQYFLFKLACTVGSALQIQSMKLSLRIFVTTYLILIVLVHSIQR